MGFGAPRDFFQGVWGLVTRPLPVSAQPPTLSIANTAEAIKETSCKVFTNHLTTSSKASPPLQEEGLEVTITTTIGSYLLPLLSAIWLPSIVFVHVKYCFILKPTGDYTAHFADPDIRFNWLSFSLVFSAEILFKICLYTVVLLPDVLQVIVNTSSSWHNLGSSKGSAILAQEDPQMSQLACLIGLSPSTAPQMTRCGHIFCYPCLLHYIELSNKGKGQGCKCLVC
ncbi:hypothetical protein PPACK8108_LOCUS7559 [Phakopsora pachyrhizi]|uniref:Zinc finger C3HC4 RING-type domain-containing protein n=1 Tax=Phakopsora pachyrhizi TaxID=170000 RepID=A0AAV0ATL1_PHAPC|nr:hypothetical protein PPACK8108_LOCUS7559 [Phakopsora pachyrhizi]